MSVLLSATDLGVSIDRRRILERVTFDVRPGEFVALMGRNGAGKSTLLDALAGLRDPDQGTLRIDGRDSARLSARERAGFVSHLPQQARIHLPLSVEDVVLMGRYPHADGWFENDRDRQRMEWALDVSGCAPFKGRRVSTLSGGEHQRVMLAACLAQSPRLMLLDEPATFLDVDQQLHCFDVLRTVADSGVACVAVTHDINLALRFCTRVIVLSDGTLARDMPVSGALEEPSWLALFSDRLAVARTDGDQTWVCFR